MRTFRLTSRQRQRLRAQLKITKDGRVAKRIFALLALDRGTRPTALATTLGITRQTRTTRSYGSRSTELQARSPIVDVQGDRRSGPTPCAGS